jgi:ethanolamine utilization microcompartment shell protein EutS
MVASLVAEIGADDTTYIYFLSVSDTLLCQVKYNELVQDGVDEATYMFKNTTITPSASVLSGSVIASDTVTQFKILEYGDTDYVNGAVVISGTVGENGSGSDIEFNTVNWSEEDAITISQLTIQLPNG